MACNFNCLIESGELCKVTGGDVHYDSGNILETVQGRDVVTAGQYYHNHLTPLFGDHPGELVPEESFF